MIPHEISEHDLWAALKPFYDLIGVTPMHIYNHPTVERGDDETLHVRFAHVLEPGVDLNWPVGHTGDGTGEWDEKTYEVDILVRQGSRIDAIKSLWPDDDYPAGTALDSGAK